MEENDALLSFLLTALPIFETHTKNMSRVRESPETQTHTDYNCEFSICLLKLNITE